MKPPPFPALFSLPRFGRLRVGRAPQVRRASPLIALSGVALMLLSPSSGQEPVQQMRDLASGQRLFNNACRTCHTTRDRDNRLGPHLYRIIGRKAGSLANYNYSSAMRSADFIWDEEKLARFMATPDELVPGNSMKPFGGVASADDRARIISFLRSDLSGQ